MSTQSDLTEQACSTHISNQVNLNWTLTGTNTHGLTSLKGISLSPAMLGLITVAPLQWGNLEKKVIQLHFGILICFHILEIFINKSQIQPQSEVTCSAGEDVTVGVRISNLSPSPLQHLSLTIQFYQDYQNGILNSKLETRVILSGPDR